MQEIINDIDGNFGKEFLRRYLAGSFGAMSKSETEILIFYLLSSLFENLSNYEISNLLKVNEIKIKNLKLNAYLRYGQNDKKIIKRVLTKICDLLEVNFDETNGEVKIYLEDPVERREFINEVKKLGSYADYSLNSEILKVKINILFELVGNLIGKERFKDVFQRYLKDKKLQDKILSDSFTAWQKIYKFLKENNLTPIEILKQTIDFIR